MAWIFQPIRDVKNDVLYAKTGTFEERLRAYNEELRKRVDPELYVRYIINGFDIYLDIELTRVAAQNVYPQLTDEQVYQWINKHKSEHHILTT